MLGIGSAAVVAAPLAASAVAPVLIPAGSRIGFDILDTSKEIPRISVPGRVYKLNGLARAYGSKY